jgi:PucR C-terminal helix-turn-helix domain/GGDEF-like domain
VVARLRSRRPEIVESITARIRNIQPTANNGDVQYEEGQLATCTACVEYALLGIEQGVHQEVPIPPEAVVQAHRAARGGIGLEVVLLRHTAGHRLFGEYVMEEARHFSPQALLHIMDLQWSLFERLVAAIAAEYKREAERTTCSSERQLAGRVKRLLAGEPGSLDAFGYRIDACHLGVIATGTRAREAIRGLEASLDRQSLCVSRDDETVWAWFGGHRILTLAEIKCALNAHSIRDATMAVGEPARGPEGWRLTHRQAQVALRVALRQQQSISYADVPLEAAMLCDELLARVHMERYLTPLADWKDGPTILPQTARAYFATGHNAEAAAAKLGVDRGTVRTRVRAIEQRLGCTLPICQAELEVALRLEELRSYGATSDSTRTSIVLARPGSQQQSPAA